MEELKIQPLSNLLSREFPESKWLVEKLVPESGLVLLSAAPASFKTWIALEVSLRIKRGEPLFGIFPTNKCNVLIADEESGDRMLQDRFKKLGAKVDECSTNDNEIYYLSRVGRYVDDDYIKELIPECLNHNIKLVIFDSLVRFHSARENDASEMSKVLNLFKILNDNGITALVLHHNRKSNGIAGGGEMIRGSSDILASCDVHLSISRRERKVTISQTKNRYMEEVKPFSIQLNVINENESNFEYLGEESDKDNQSIELKNQLLKTINENPGINKSQLINAIADGNNNLPNNRIAKAISELIKQEEVRVEQGIKNSLKLFINN